MASEITGEDVACQCDSCDWAGRAADTGYQGRPSGLMGIQNLAERLDPGSEVPAGECPRCGSLANVRTPQAAARRGGPALLDCAEQLLAVMETPRSRKGMLRYTQLQIAVVASKPPMVRPS